MVVLIGGVSGAEVLAASPDVPRVNPPYEIFNPRPK
jgi:hypothetical protein